MNAAEQLAAQRQVQARIRQLCEDSGLPMFDSAEYVDGAVRFHWTKRKVVAIVDLDGAESFAASHADPTAPASPDATEDYCEECGADYPADAPSLTGAFHAESCSLHVSST